MSQALELIRQFDAVPSYRDENGFEKSFEAYKVWDVETDRILKEIDDLCTTEFRFPDMTPYGGIATMIDETIRVLDYYTNYYKLQWLLESAGGQYRCAIQIADSPYTPMVETISFTHANMNLAILGAVAKHQERAKAE